MIAPKRTVNAAFLIPVGLLIALGLLMLLAIAPSLFPAYYLYILAGIGAFILFSRIDLDVLAVFSKHLFVLSLLLLILPPLIGQVTRGVIRWIPLGSLTIQPSEIVRPFILLFFANYLVTQQVTARKLVMGIGLFTLPFVLIVLQPSLGVAVLTGIGFLGILFAADMPKKYFAYFAVIAIALSPIVWFLLAPYQQNRILSFINPASDPYGSGYNSIQSTISVGSGGLMGRGLGKGVQTQLDFLPERETDFMFASIAEELGFLGGVFVITTFFALLWSIVKLLESAKLPMFRAFIAGFGLSLFAQIAIHVGMNMALLPITGVPLPLVSAGGSSFVATMIGLGMVYSVRK